MTEIDLTIAVVAAGPDQVAAVEKLAASLGLPVETPEAGSTEIQLLKQEDHLELRQAGKGAPGAVYIDFTGGKSAHRRRFGGGRGQPLAKAIGLKHGNTPDVIDATAGLGRDAFVLASLGCSVRLVERSPIISALLQDAFERALADNEVAPIASRMQLIQMDAKAFILALPDDDRPDVVYLDPMYPHRNKSALVKKEMRIFRQLVGDDMDSAELLTAARAIALNRVVVKRPAKAPCLGDQQPTMVIKSPNTRYDVYLTGNK